MYTHTQIYIGEFQLCTVINDNVLRKAITLRQQRSSEVLPLPIIPDASWKSIGKSAAIKEECAYPFLWNRPQLSANFADTSQLCA